VNRRINYRIDIGKYRVREYKDGRERTIGHFDNLLDAKICQAGHHWIDGKDPDPKNFFGFVYEIEDKLTGMKYIGKKQYYFYRGTCETSNDIEKDDWNRECWEESDWRFYCSSSEILKHIIAERHGDFYFRILDQATSKLKLHLMEVDYQVKYDVLNAELPNGDRMYWNQNIASCEFKVHDMGEGARAIRYNPLYRAWKKMLTEGPVKREWNNWSTFKKEMGRKAKNMVKPVILRRDNNVFSEFNTIIINKDEGYTSPIYKGVGYVDGRWRGRIVSEDKVYEVLGISERDTAAHLDELIKREGLNLEPQLKWV
jgi:hypothetical protein